MRHYAIGHYYCAEGFLSLRPLLPVTLATTFAISHRPPVTASHMIAAWLIHSLLPIILPDTTQLLPLSFHCHWLSDRYRFHNIYFHYYYRHWLHWLVINIHTLIDTHWCFFARLYITLSLIFFSAFQKIRWSRFRWSLFRHYYTLPPPLPFHYFHILLVIHIRHFLSSLLRLLFSFYYCHWLLH